MVDPLTGTRHSLTLVRYAPNRDAYLYALPNQMPTTASAEPLAPGQKRTPSESVAYGRMQWTRKWKVFASQWSQPQLMKLAEAVLGEKALHSSQIHGFTTGKLRDPAPKVVMAVGKLNKAIAFANGADVLMDEFDGRCPETMPDLWRGKSWMIAPNGRVLGELECFAAITGMLDLATEGAHLDLHKGNMPAVSKSLGKYLRRRYIERGIDFMEVLQDPVKLMGPGDYLVETLLYGKEITGADFDRHKEVIAEAAGVEVDQLVDEAVLPVLLASEG